jgi:omega-hydroxy-beta-dihydromenaquinone-9 sulfotransferase
MTVGPWLRLLARHRFAVSPGRLPMALAVSALSLANSAAAAVQRARYGRAIAGADIAPPPLFIIGHWRSGTTMLHELLALDPQFRCPTTYECMAPAHFLVTGRATRHLGRLLPPHRPLDEMRLRWDLPQEDEFALANLGVPSPYDAFAFPRQAAPWEEGLDPRRLPSADRERWQQALRAFTGSLVVACPGRLVLKSPAHTARLGLLTEMFPGAQFIHAVRDPGEMVPSLLVAWHRMAAAVGLQTGFHAYLDDYLLRLGAGLYRRFPEDTAALAPGRIVDVRYEDLVGDPAAALDGLYQALGLPHPERIGPMVAQYLAAVGPYRTNDHPAPPELRRRITVLWGGYARRYGYGVDPPEAPA